MNEAVQQPSSLTFILHTFYRCRGGTQLYVPTAHAPLAAGAAPREAI